MKKIVLPCCLFFFMTGCVSNTQLYYWGNYTNARLNYVKTPSQKTRLAYQRELLSIIDKSNEKNTPVPPGIYAELGKLKMEDGLSNEATPLFIAEATLYPESQTFLSTYLQKPLTLPEKTPPEEHKTP